ncbi:MAG: PHP domain-containing protein [Pseudomonadota bacterium]
MDLIDLHAHSTASDGSLAPTALARHARDLGLRAIALTDHDTIAGINEAAAAAERFGLELVPGVEMSSYYSGGTMHILGYYLDCSKPGLLQELSRLQRVRAERNQVVLAKLNELGIELSFEDVLRLAGKDGQVGRPHFARALLSKGVVGSIDEAFERYLKKGAPAYSTKFRLPPAEAISLIRKAGGVAVLAHPFTLFLDEDPRRLNSLLCELKDLGLSGVEVYYTEHSEKQERLYSEAARSCGLIMTGGSDYHGANKEDTELGKGHGNLRIPYGVLEEVKAARRALMGGTPG